MLSSIEERIIAIIRENKSIKAKKIAQELGVERSEVNHYLYSSLRSVCVQNEAYEWSLREEVPFESEDDSDVMGKSIIDEPTEEEPINTTIIGDNMDDIDPPEASTTTITDPLQKLCNYYIECVLSEQDNGKEVYAESQWELKYRDVDNWPDRNGINTDSALDLIQKIMTSQSVEGYFGYPVLVKWNGNYKKLAPIFFVGHRQGNRNGRLVSITNYQF